MASIIVTDVSDTQGSKLMQRASTHYAGLLTLIHACWMACFSLLQASTGRTLG